MSIRQHCDECGSNDLVGVGVEHWYCVVAKRSGELHFCSMECVQAYSTKYLVEAARLHELAVKALRLESTA